MKTITFNELRRIKDLLPDGSMQQIADKLDISIETVRNYFGGTDYLKGDITGFHTEQGPDGGSVMLDDATIYEIAMKILKERNLN